jgi:hypothetical protein
MMQLIKELLEDRVLWGLTNKLTNSVQDDTVVEVFNGVRQPMLEVMRVVREPIEGARRPRLGAQADQNL